MKAIKLILLGVSLFSILPLGAQVFDIPRSLAEADSLDRVQYRILYQLDFISDPTDREYVTQDQVRLDIGTQISKVYSLLVCDTTKLTLPPRPCSRLGSFLGRS